MAGAVESGYFAGTRFRAARTRSGVKGTWVTRAPVASKTALARAAATGTTGGSPMPWVIVVPLFAVSYTHLTLPTN